MQNNSHNNSQSLHEAWALAGLMRARYGMEALSKAMHEAHKTASLNNPRDKAAAPIWQSVVECLSC